MQYTVVPRDARHLAECTTWQQVGLLPVPRRRFRALEVAVLAVLAAAVVGDAVLITLLHRKGF